MRKLVTVLFVAVLCVAVNSVSADMAVDYIDHDGSNWVVNPTGIAGGYKSMSVMQDYVQNGKSTFYAAGSGGLDAIAYNGSNWVASQISSYTNYNAVAAIYNGLGVYAAHQGGGLDRVSASGVTEATGITTSYTALTTLNYGQYKAFGTRASGGVDLIRLGASGYETVEAVADGAYNSIAGTAGTVTGIDAYSFLATKVGGGVDYVYTDGVDWIRESNVFADEYTTISARDIFGNGRIEAYAARADGGLDVLYWDGSAWNKVNFIATGNYDSLAGGAYYGGVDGRYTMMASSVPEPATLGLLALGGLFGIRRRKSA